MRLCKPISTAIVLVLMVLAFPSLTLARAEVVLVAGGYNRDYALINSWDYAADFVDAVALTELLGRSGIPLDVMSDHEVEQGALTLYKVAILPAASCISDLGVRRVQEFAAAGGQVIATYDTSRRNEFFGLRPNYALSDLMGAAFAGYTDTGVHSIRPQTNHPVFRSISGNIAMPRRRTMVTRVLPGARVLGTWVGSDGRTAPISLDAAIIETERCLYFTENIFARRNMSDPKIATMIANSVQYLLDRYKAEARETRALWYRPAATADGIRSDLAKMARAGFNTLFIEAFYHGYTIYPSSIAQQRPEFVGFDPLKVAIEEGARLGIDVHAWIETFYVGPGVGEGVPGPIIDARPDWAAVGSDGRKPVAIEANKYFLSPAHPEVQDYLTVLLTELVRAYEVHGVHLDYLRYPTSRLVSYDFNPVVRAIAKEELGFDPIDVRINVARWNAWFEWRRDSLTAFVGRLSQSIREENPKVKISAAVGIYQDAVLSTMQDWKVWAEAGYLDFVVVQTFTPNPELLETYTLAALDLLKGRIPVYPSIDLVSIPGISSARVLSMLSRIRSTGAKGAAMFTLNALTDDHIAALSSGPFKYPTKAYHR